MMMNSKLLGIVFLLLLVAGGIFYFARANFVSFAPQELTECTADAKICPDGTAVGRVAPKCEFAACPPVATSSPDVATYKKGDTEEVTAKLGHGTVALGELITPIAILEDSRCPAGVQCVWAGTVKVRGTVRGGMGVGSVTFELGKEVTTEVNAITLIEVRPVKNEADIPPTEYQFVFKVVRR